ncbi:hypothetical protein ACVWY2_008681 [Bradyrhizobium sp. JR6.1]
MSCCAAARSHHLFAQSEFNWSDLLRHQGVWSLRRLYLVKPNLLIGV